MIHTRDNHVTARAYHSTIMIHSRDNHVTARAYHEVYTYNNQ